MKLIKLLTACERHGMVKLTNIQFFFFFLILIGKLRKCLRKQFIIIFPLWTN